MLTVLVLPMSDSSLRLRFHFIDFPPNEQCNTLDLALKLLLRTDFDRLDEQLLLCRNTRTPEGIAVTQEYIQEI